MRGRDGEGKARESDRSGERDRSGLSRRFRFEYAQPASPAGSGQVQGRRGLSCRHHLCTICICTICLALNLQERPLLRPSARPDPGVAAAVAPARLPGWLPPGWLPHVCRRSRMSRGSAAMRPLAQRRDAAPLAAVPASPASHPTRHADAARGPSSTTAEIGLTRTGRYTRPVVHHPGQGGLPRPVWAAWAAVRGSRDTGVRASQLPGRSGVCAQP